MLVACLREDGHRRGDHRRLHGDREYQGFRRREHVLDDNAPTAPATMEGQPRRLASGFGLQIERWAPWSSIHTV